MTRWQPRGLDTWVRRGLSALWKKWRRDQARRRNISTAITKDITVTLLPKGSATDAEYVLFFSRGFDDKVVLDVTLRRPQEIASKLKERLPALLEPLRQDIGLVEMELNEAQIARALRRLERLQCEFLLILLDNSAGVTPSNFVKQLSEALRPVFTQPGRVPVVEIKASAEDRLAWLVPFEFLPIAYVPSEYQTIRDGFQKFLGFRAEIVRSLRGGPSAIQRDPGGRLPVHLFAYAGPQPPPPYGITQQVDYLKAYTAIASIWPTSGSVTDSFEGPSQLAHQLISLPKPIIENVIHCVAHFTCHFDDASGFDFGQCIDGSKLSVKILELRAELELQHGTGPRAALVFLNACRTAAIDKYGESSLLRVFAAGNSGAVIGSEALLPDRLAAQFAIHFYEQLIRGSAVGRAVISARRFLLERYSNPAGLFYTVYGNPMLRA